MRSIALLSVAWLAIPIFSNYLINGTIFGEKYLENKTYFDFPYNLRPKHFSLLEVFSEIGLLSQVYIGHHLKFPLLLLNFHEIWIFPSDFRKVFSITIFF